MRPDLLPTTIEGKLSHVVEECGEVLQCIGKWQRFGAQDTDRMTGITYDNAADVLLEMAQLVDAIKAVQEHLRNG